MQEDKKEKKLISWNEPFALKKIREASFWIFTLWFSGLVINVGSDYASDYYYIDQVKKSVKKALQTHSNDTLLEQKRSEEMRILVEKAHEYNAKIRRMTRCNEEAIDELESEYLR